MTESSYWNSARLQVACFEKKETDHSHAYFGITEASHRTAFEVGDALGRYAAYLEAEKECAAGTRSLKGSILFLSSTFFGGLIATSLNTHLIGIPVVAGLCLSGVFHNLQSVVPAGRLPRPEDPTGEAFAEALSVFSPKSLNATTVAGLESRIREALKGNDSRVIEGTVILFHQAVANSKPTV